MRAVRFHAYGPASRLRVDQVPDPVSGPSDVLIRVRAAAVNHWDLDMRSGTSRLPLTLPHQPGIELAGEIAAVGSDTSGFEVGTRVLPRFQWVCGKCAWCAAGEENHCNRLRVLGATEPGSYAEYVAVPAVEVIRLPDSVSFDEAAALQATFAPVWHALTGRIQLRKGMTILVNAAGSGAGNAAIQIARHLGARVFASAGSDDKLERARQQGVEATINYEKDDIAGRVRAMTSGVGVDVVFDCVGGAVFTASLSALAWNGQLVTVGAHAGEQVTLDLIPLFRNQWSIIGSANNNRRDTDSVLQLLAEGAIRPVIDRRYGLEEAAAAHEALEQRRVFGKVLLIP
ncbi:MAG TPA: zinc-binding dehydrogenase [Candidatus Dormibacteraeota bacterium]